MTGGGRLARSVFDGSDKGKGGMRSRKRPLCSMFTAFVVHVDVCVGFSRRCNCKY